MLIQFETKILKIKQPNLYTFYFEGKALCPVFCCLIDGDYWIRCLFPIFLWTDKCSEESWPAVLVSLLPLDSCTRPAYQLPIPPTSSYLQPLFPTSPHQAGIPALLSHSSVLPSPHRASTNPQYFRNANATDTLALKIENYKAVRLHSLYTAQNLDNCFMCVNYLCKFSELDGWVDN